MERLKVGRSFSWYKSSDEMNAYAQEPNTELYRPALETLRTLIRTSTSSMTSVPKPLKFLHPHYRELQTIYEGWLASEDKVSLPPVVPVHADVPTQSLFADILSVLAMTYSDTEPRGTLRYRLLSSSLRPSASSSPLSTPGSWGHEYVRHLAAELGEEHNARTLGEDVEAEVKPVEGDKEDAVEEKKEEARKPVEVIGSTEELQELAMECATFLLQHNAEPDAVDLLEELEIADRIAELVDENTYERVCQYMIRYVRHLLGIA